MTKRGLIPAFLLGMMACCAAAELKVVSLHPLIGDLLRQVGGDKIKIVDLIGINGDPHSFEPQPSDLRAAQDAEIYFVSGMGLESYLPNLEAILGGRSRIVEVGKTLPALEGNCDHEDHDHDHHHHDHELDPHWWHSVDLFRRAAGVVADELVKADPDNQETFLENARVYRTKLDELEKWVKREVVKIPKDRRQLATAHAAFQYFCEAYGFKSYSVQGLNREQMPDAATLAALIATLRNEGVPAIFPERESNPRTLVTLTQDTGLKLGGTLIADGTGVTSYEEMIRSNVATIVEGLTE